MAEDFTTWSPGEEDLNNHITISTDKVAFAGLSRNESAWYVNDYGVGNFSNIDIIFRVKITASATSSQTAIMVLSNVIDDLLGILLANEDSICTFWNKSGGNDRISLFETSGGLTFQDNSINLSLNTDYYINRTINGTNCAEKIYSDTELTVLVDTVSLTLQDTYTFQYLFAVDTWNSGNALAQTGEVGDLDLQEAVAGVVQKVIGLFGLGKLGLRI